MRTATRVVIGSVALALAATACGGSGGSGGGGGESKTKSFTANLAEPRDLIPGQTNEDQGSRIDNLLFDPLTGVNNKGEATNLVAKSVKSQDRQHWTIKLKDGWTFHNGEPVTAQSFVGAWNATLHNAWNNSYFFTDVLGIKGAQKVAKKKAKTMSGVQAVGDKTIKVTLNAANVDFPLVIGYTAFDPMPESVLKSKDWKKFKNDPIGNGPYKMAEPWKHNQYIKLKKFANYAGEEPGKADEIDFTIYSDPDTAYNDVIGGNLDISTNIPTSRLESAPKDFGDRYVKNPSSSFTYLGFPLWLKRYQNVKARKAFSMAINRDEVSKQIFAGTVTPAKSLVTPLIKLGHRDDACGDPCSFDPTKAKQLLQESGFDTSKPVTFWYNTGAGNEDWVQAVANQIHKNLGLKVKLKGQAWAQYLDTTDGHKVTGPYRLGWVMDYPGPANYLGTMYGTGAGSNGTGYSNKAVDKALAKGKSAKTPEESVKYYHKAEDLILQDMPSIPLWFGQRQAVHTDRLSNITYDAEGYIRYDQIEVSD